MVDVRQPISRVKSLPSLGDPKKGLKFSQAPRFELPRSRPQSAQGANFQEVPRSRPQSAKGANSQEVPGQKTKKRRDKDQEVPADRARKEWKACPVKELLPSEVCKEVRSIAPDGGVVIEMLWGSSTYLPAHNGGHKYVKNAERLQELLAGRLSGGFPLPVHIVDEPIQGDCKTSALSRLCIKERTFATKGIFQREHKRP